MPFGTIVPVSFSAPLRARQGSEERRRLMVRSDKPGSTSDNEPAPHSQHQSTNMSVVVAAASSATTPVLDYNDAGSPAGSSGLVPQLPAVPDTRGRSK